MEGPNSEPFRTTPLRAGAWRILDVSILTHLAVGDPRVWSRWSAARTLRVLWQWLFNSAGGEILNYFIGFNGMGPTQRLSQILNYLHQIFCKYIFLRRTPRYQKGINRKTLTVWKGKLEPDTCCLLHKYYNNHSTSNITLSQRQDPDYALLFLVYT